MEVYSDRIGVDQDEQERLRFSPDDIVKLPVHRAMNLWVAGGIPRAGFLAGTLPMEELRDTLGDSDSRGGAAMPVATSPVTAQASARAPVNANLVSTPSIVRPRAYRGR